MRIRIQFFTSVRIRILLLIKVLGILDHWSILSIHGSILSLESFCILLKCGSGSSFSLLYGSGSGFQNILDTNYVLLFRAVAPNARENHDAAERRRQMIQESKYLGGDMEHTHLVKGLDFALLQKVRMRILTDVSTSIPIIIESGFSENNKFCVTV
jgi:hypothetical protein